MTKHIFFTLAVAALAIAFSACNPDAVAESGMSVEIKIEPHIISSGFVKCTFKTNKDAYYHIGIVPVSDAPDTTQAASIKSFMTLQLDRAYALYMEWRGDILAQGIQPVAEFATHSLQYGIADYNFTMLEPDTEYMIYAFVVNSHTNQPDGRLYTYYLRTEQTSLFEDMQFEYRVRGYWDYVYPTFYFFENDGAVIVEYVPWAEATVDSLTLVQYGYANPHAYFVETFAGYVLFNEDARIHYGIYAHNNNGLGDGSSYTLFEENHTYYSGITLMDGYQSIEASVVYKFTWSGEGTQLYFTDEDSLPFGEW